MPHGTRDPYAMYEVQFRYDDNPNVRTTTVTLLEDYGAYEDMRKMIVLRITGNAADVDKIDILAVTKTWSKP